MIKQASKFLLDSSREYSIYVCSTRAIPSIEDGLKEGQRIALWLLRNRAEKLKTFALSGLMGYERLYVHGETSANNAIGLLAAPFKNNVPLIEGLGQFGSRVQPVDGIGAPRYTEVRRSKAAELLLYRDLDLVPLKENYDGSKQMAQHFLPLIPTVLLNGVSGVAVGWSTNILPHDIKALISATQDALQGKKIKPLVPHYARYDIRIARGEKPNQWVLEGKAEIVDTSTVRITELPPGLMLEDFRKTLIALEDEKKINDFIDRSTESIDITVKMARGSVRTWKEKDVIDFFKLREKVTERIVVVDWNASRIRTYENPEEVIESFAQWRLGWYTKRYEKLLADTSYELIYWQVLKALFGAGFTKKLGTFADRGAVEVEVTSVAKKSKLSLDDEQMDRVVSLPTYRWTKAFEAEVEAKIADLLNAIADHKKTLASSDLLRNVYLAELEELKKKVA